MKGMSFEKNLEKYARLLVVNGINIQDGQTLVINASVEMADFVRILAKVAYEKGARHVHAEYRDEQLSLIKYLHAPTEAFAEIEQWRADGQEEMARKGAAFLSLTGMDPDLYQKVDADRIATANQTRSRAYKGYYKYILNSVVSWCVAAIPNPAWAKKVFPELSEQEATDKLWDYIFRMNRVYEEDPVKAWEDHVRVLNERMEKLNALKLQKLHFQSPKTDLTIGLPKGHRWAGGGEYNANKVYFIANMPTEEIFTAPAKYEVDGYVSSTMPLNYSGTLIEDFILTFREGKIVSIQAGKGEETLQKLIDTDKGSSYLGEVALVADDSPISNTKTIYYDTLFDENASCHLAIGAAYPINLEGGEHLSEEELERAGLNTSLTHVDFMIGSDRMNITGQTAAGDVIQIFRNGNWVL